MVSRKRLPCCFWSEITLSGVENAVDKVEALHSRLDGVDPASASVGTKGLDLRNALAGEWFPGESCPDICVRRLLMKRLSITLRFSLRCCAAITTCDISRRSAKGS